MSIQKIPKERVLDVIEKLGPCQPIDIRKELKLGDTFLIGAMLSEFLAEGTLVLTKVRRGGGPFYYDPHKAQSIEPLSKYLNEKDRRTYALLKEHLVLREDAQEPLTRVGLQHMEDFSKPIEVDGVQYWKYYLISDDDAKKIIKSNGIDTIEQQPDEPMEEELEQVEKDIEKIEDSVQFDEKTENKKEKKEKTPPVQEVVPSSKESDDLQKKSVQETVKEAPKKKERKKKIETTSDAAQQITLDPTVASNEQPTAEKPKKKRVSKKKALPAPTVTAEGSVVIAPEAWLAHDTLYERILAFANGASIREQKVIKPNAQLSCIMTTDLPYGKLDIMIMAFNRKFTDDDLAKAVASAKEKGLPILLLSVDPFPSKMTTVFKGFSNVMFKQFEAKQKT